MNKGDFVILVNKALTAARPVVGRPSHGGICGIRVKLLVKARQ
jgi:hypothetical protein